MKINYKHFLISFFMLLYLVLYEFVSSELVSIITLGVIIFLLFYNKLKINKNVLVIISPLIGMLFIGIFRGYNNDFRDYVRDFFYYINPILVIILGNLLSVRQENINKLLKCVVWFSILVSFIHIFKILTVNSFDYNTIRTICGTDSYTEIIGLIILFCDKKYNLRVCAIKNFELIAVIILGLSSILYLSRMMIGFGLIIFVVFAYNKKRFIKTITIIILAITLLLCTYNALKHLSNESTNKLYYKISNSINEITSVQDFSNYTSIITNWRGYEAYKAKQQFYNQDVINQLVGSGFGSSIQLGLTIKLAGEEHNNIAITHNNYWSIVIKTGILGLILYFLFIFTLIIKSNTNSNDANIIFISKLSKSLTLSILFITLIVMGIFVKNPPFMILFLSSTFINVIDEYSIKHNYKRIVFRIN